MTSDGKAALATRVLRTIFRHTDGIAIGSTMAALYDRGAFKILTRADQVPFELLRHELDANAGFLRVAMRLLADQGWVVFRGAPDPAAMIIEPTPRGRAVFDDFAHAYAIAGEFPPLGRPDEDLLHDSHADQLAHQVALMRREWGLPTRSTRNDGRRQVLAHLNGHLLAPLMLAMMKRDMLRVGADIAFDGRSQCNAVSVLAWQGWAQTSGKTAWLTPEGEVAVACVRQYRYPLVYLPLLRRVDQLLFGVPTTASGEETHLDRALDLRFSGDVFDVTCRRPFLAIALPLFGGASLDDQPALVVDTGCGNGAVLESLHSSIRGSTTRGRHLDTHPLLMVGVDPSPVAREATAARLGAAGIPHLVLDGDIADPERLRRDLAAHGYRAEDALHICKAAIHDRAHSAAGTQPVAAAPPPTSYGAFADSDGSDIPATDIAYSLTALMRDWRSLIRRFGWIVMEAQAAPAEVTARLLGSTPATSLDATHGYSSQYPVEPEVFSWAAREAGFTSRRHAEPGAAQVGHPILTIDHFVVTR